METAKFVAVAEFFTILALVVWAVINYWNRRETKKQTWKLKAKVSFLESVGDLIFPEWEILDSLSYADLKVYSNKLVRLFYSQFFEEEIDLKKIGEYLNGIDIEISSDEKKEVIKECLKTALMQVYFEKIADYLLLSTKKECLATKKAADFIAETVRSRLPENDLRIFFSNIDTYAPIILKKVSPEKEESVLKRIKHLRAVEG